MSQLVPNNNKYVTKIDGTADSRGWTIGELIRAREIARAQDEAWARYRKYADVKFRKAEEIAKQAKTEPVAEEPAPSMTDFFFGKKEEVPPPFELGQKEEPAQVRQLEQCPNCLAIARSLGYKDVKSCTVEKCEECHGEGVQ